MHLPGLQVLRELDIPNGSMSVPDDVKELRVVIDQRGSLQRVAAGGALLAGLAFASVAAAQAAVAAGHVV
jgi:hypothetical protein